MKYFVLKPAGNDAYARASRAAMRRYAVMIQEENNDLADGLLAWVNRKQADAEKPERELK